MNKSLILLDKNRALSKLPSIIKKRDLCYLLSKDYTSYLKLNKSVPDSCKVLNLDGRFNREIKILRKDYLKLFVDLSKKHDSLEWWSSHIASKNSASIPLQLNITYLFCAKKILDEFNSIQNPNNRVIFIADSQALLNSINILGEERNFNVFQYKERVKNLIYYFKRLFLYLAKISFFVWNNYRYRKLAFSILKPMSFNHTIKRKKVVIRSWITKGTLNEDGLFVDRNFGDLPNWLKSKGLEVIILPMFFNLDKSIKDMYSLIKKQNFHFLIQDHYLKLVDYIYALYLGWKQINIPLKKIALKTLDLTLLFREVQLQEGFNLGNLSLNLSYPLIKRLKELEVDIDRFYYPFENNVPEKLFILGCKKYFSDSEVIAYQHTVWYKNQLGMFLGDNETHHPIADKVICSGPIYLDVLRNVGFPENRLVAGPNLRFTSVHRDGSTLKKNIKRPNILLPLTFDNDLAYDLLHKIKIILSDFPDWYVYIRTHPLLNQNELTNFFNEINIVNFEYAVDGSIQDWLLNTDIVLSTGGSIVIVETVAMGVPLIRVEPDNNFFLDPLAWTDYPIKPVNSPAEISSSINLILKMLKEDKDKFQVIGKDVLFNYFTEIDEDNIKVFC